MVHVELLPEKGAEPPEQRLVQAVNSDLSLVLQLVRLGRSSGGSWLVAPFHGLEKLW